tara:strand:- start:6758 stop:7582 length:825 start_codon:yes stop_codon:yes gene_type:complete
MFFSASVIIFNTNKDDLRNCLFSLLKSKMIGVIVIVNNGEPQVIDIDDSRIHLIQNKDNVGYGAAQNIAVNYLTKHYSYKYHIFCNPDVSFDELIIEKSYDYLQNNDDVGMLGPKITFPDGSLYPSARLLPSAMTQFCRFFLKPAANFFKYELNDYKYDVELEIPFVCGAFSIVRMNVFEDVGYFDERFFLYQEDIDFSRRVHMKYKTIIYPQINVVHKLGRESHKKIKIMIYHAISIIKFYNKWGWIIDKERRNINRNCLHQVKKIYSKRVEL